MVIDIHAFEQQYAAALEHLAKSDISERNKELIRSYCDACLLRQVCGKVRLIRAVIILNLLARQLGKDFDQATRPDLERLLSGLLNRQPAYSVVTISTYKKVLRRFLSYVYAPNDFPRIKQLPESIAWIIGHVRKRDQPTIKRGDLLTPADIELLLHATIEERDRALFAMLWESGARISELGNMQIKNVTRTGNGYTLDITGKTGSRTPLIISSAPYLAGWLAHHPMAGNGDAPLWPQHRSKRPMTYDGIARVLQRTFKRAGLTKPCNPHIFRHSRVTYVLANGIMNEQQAKVYFGWAPDSDMPGATYAHLIDTDVNNAILRENNLAPHQETHRELQPVRCRICNELSPPRSEYCQRCSAVLDLKRAYEHQQLHDLKEQLFTNMFKLMVERGLVDEAAREIHDAGLGSVLKRLAMHVRESEAGPRVKEKRSPVKEEQMLQSEQLASNT
jgi:integrase